MQQNGPQPGPPQVDAAGSTSYAGVPGPSVLQQDGPPEIDPHAPPPGPPQNDAAGHSSYAGQRGKKDNRRERK